MRRIVLVLSLICFLTSGIITAQEIDLETVEINTKNLNSDYLDKVQNDLCPTSVVKLQDEIAAFDIKQLPRYKRNEVFHQVLFKTTNGNIYTNYEKGRIVNAKGKFKNVILPKKLVASLLEENDGWQIEENNYLTTYEYDGINSNRYFIVLTDGTQSKRIQYRID